MQQVFTMNNMRKQILKNHLTLVRKLSHLSEGTMHHTLIQWEFLTKDVSEDIKKKLRIIVGKVIL